MPSGNHVPRAAPVRGSRTEARPMRARRGRGWTAVVALVAHATLAVGAAVAEPVQAASPAPARSAADARSVVVTSHSAAAAAAAVRATGGTVVAPVDAVDG